MISVLIATKNRSSKLKVCLQYLLRSSFKDFEILILDQSKDKKTMNIAQSFKNKKIKYIPTKKIGKSAAINLGVSNSKGEIISLTDDDCIVDPSWLLSISKYFKSHPKISGVFGRTLPYQPFKHTNYTCPAVFNRVDEAITTDPGIIFCTFLGQGNNMSIRKAVLVEVGKMNVSFGPGALVETAEDCDLISRMLIKGKALAYTPTILVYHNRWITHSENNSLQLKYTLGICASAMYSYLSFHNPSVLNLLRYKLREHIFGRIRKIKNRSDVRLLLNQLGVIFMGIYMGINLKLKNY